MTPFEAFQLYQSLKLHFMSETYDYFRYQGKTHAKPEGFEMRKDKFYFAKLAKHRDPKAFILGNIIDGDMLTKWIGGLMTNPEADKIYLGWLKRQQSLTYIFQQQRNLLIDNLKEYFIIHSGQHPTLLKMFLANKISYEFLIIMNDIVTYFPYWNSQLKDDVIWRKLELKCVKYRPFLSYDLNKFKLVNSK